MSLNENQHRTPCLAFTLAAVKLKRPGSLARQSPANVLHISRLLVQQRDVETKPTPAVTPGVLPKDARILAQLSTHRYGLDTRVHSVTCCPRWVTRFFCFTDAVNEAKISEILRYSRHVGVVCGGYGKAPGKHTARVRWGRGVRACNVIPVGSRPPRTATFWKRTHHFKKPISRQTSCQPWTFHIIAFISRIKE